MKVVLIFLCLICYMVLERLSVVGLCFFVCGWRSCLHYTDLRDYAKQFELHLYIYSAQFKFTKRDSQCTILF